MPDGEEDALLRDGAALSPWRHGGIILFSSQGTFLWSVTYSTYVPLLIFFAKEYGFGPEGIGIASACAHVGWLVAFPLLRFVSPTIAVALGGLVYTAAPILFVSIPSLWALSVTRLCEGFALALLMRTLAAELAWRLPVSLERQGANASSFLGQLGKAYGLLASFVLHPAGGFRLVLLVVSALGAAVILVSAGGMLAKRWLRSREEKSGLPAAAFGELCQGATGSLLLLHAVSCIGQGVVLVILPLHLGYVMGLSMKIISALFFLVDILLLPAGALTIRIANAFRPWALNMSLFAVQTFILLGLGCLGFLDLRPRAGWVAAQGTFVALVAACLLLGSSAGGLISPLFSLLAEEVEIRSGKGSSKDISECIGVVGLAVGAMVGGIGYAFVGCHGLLISLATIMFACLSTVAAATWQGSDDSEGMDIAGSLPRLGHNAYAPLAYYRSNDPRSPKSQSSASSPVSQSLSSSPTHSRARSPQSTLRGPSGDPKGGTPDGPPRRGGTPDGHPRGRAKRVGTPDGYHSALPVIKGSPAASSPREIDAEEGTGGARPVDDLELAA